MSGSVAWAGGYTVDVSYIDPIAPEVCPAWISLACVLNGQPPLPSDRPLVWAELGCGGGLGTSVVAAANDDVEVWGIDINPSHIDRARAFTAAAEVDRCTFLEAGFEDLARDDAIGPHDVDVISIHGVYSWISPENQRHITEFVRRRLRPGGVVYVTYEVPTGWASMVPVAELLRLHVENDPRRSDLAIGDAIAYAHRLASSGAGFFPLGPGEARQFRELPDADPRYAAHEYLGHHFRPLMFDEVAGAMSLARCSYVGSINPTDHLSAFAAPAPLLPLLQEIDDPVTRELVRDLIGQRQLRRDLFRRGLRPMSTAIQRAAYEQLSLVGLGKVFEEPVSVGVPLGEVTLPGSLYRPLVEALATEHLDLAGIRRITGFELADAIAALSFLVGGGYGAPVAKAEPGAAVRSACRRVNETLIAENATGADHGCLAAPVSGGAVVSDYVELAVVGLILAGHPSDVDLLAPMVLRDLADQERFLRREGGLITEPDEAVAEVRRRTTTALERASTSLRRLGVL